MINEERVKELYKVAQYDSEKRGEYQRIRRYYRGDYIGIEILKSFFTGTILFLMLCVVWGVVNGQELMEQVNHIDYISIGKDVGVLYGLFMIVYLVITWIVYAIRYAKGKKGYLAYGENLKKIQRMYSREDKLKM